MPRRLVNRIGGDLQTASQTPAPDSSARSVTYEPPSFPLNEVAVNKLGDLSRSRDTNGYNNHIKGVLRHLGHGVYDLHDRLLNQRQRLEKTRSQREARGGEKQADEERREEHIAQLEAEVENLTKRSEASVRATIDHRVALEDDAVVLGELYTNASINQYQENDENQQQDEDERPPPPSMLSQLRDQRTDKKRAFEAIPNSERYAQDNDYAGFKKLWHEGYAGADGPPLADASRWFTQDGTPVMTSGAGGGGDGDDSDDDLAVAREVRSLKCPLTLRQLEEPYSNKKCSHTFEKSAILDYLSTSRGELQCPQTGCSEKFTRARFNEDFYLDQLILRKIQRARQASEAHAMETESVGDDDDEGQSVIAQGHRSRRGVPKREAD